MVKPGEHYTVIVNGRTFDTYITENRVQRFVGNKVIRNIVDDMLRNPGTYTLNDIAREFAMGEIPLDDMIDFYVAMEYSVSGFGDVFEDAEITNSLHTK